MPITSKLSGDGSELQIAIEGRFDFSLQQQFRQAYETGGAKPKRFLIEMSAASYLDKSALGMLLLLRDYAGGDRADIGIVNCGREVRATLAAANFERLFSIR